MRRKSQRYEWFMNEYIANFWICGKPDEISAQLNLNPTSIKLNDPYDYWNYEISSQAMGNDVVIEMLCFIESICESLIPIKQKYTMGITFIIKTAENGSDTFHIIEPDELKRLSKLNIGVAFQTITRHIPSE